MSFARVFVAFLLAGLTLSACAPRKVVTPPPVAPPVQAAAPSSAPAPAPPAKEALPAPAPLADFRLESPATSAYGAPVAMPAADPQSAKLTGEVLARFAKQGQTLQSDPALNVAARELSRYFALTQTRPSAEFLRFALQWVGTGDAAPSHFLYGLGPNAPEAELMQALDGFIKGLKTHALTHLGLGLYAQPGGPTYLAVLATERRLLIEPLPKRIDGEHRFLLKGRCAETCGKLTAYLDFMGERVFDAPVEARRGGFWADIQVPQAPALYELEITEALPQGSRVLASYTLYGGLDPKASFSEERPETVNEPQEALAERLETVINAQRKLVGLAPLGLDPTLRQEAAAHSAEMLAKHYVSAVDRAGRSAETRLKARGLEVLGAGELVEGAYAQSALESHFGQSPSLKSTMTNTSLTHLGCGLARKAREQGADYWVGSCLLATVAEKGSNDELAERLFARLNELRTQAKRPAFEANPALLPIAQKALDDLLKEPEQATRIQGEVAVAMERAGVVKGGGVYGVFTFFSLAQIGEKSVVAQLLGTNYTTLVLALRKELAPVNGKRGVFVYYLAYR